MKLKYKCILSIILIILSFCAFALTSRIEISKTEEGVTITKTNEGIAKFFEWIGISLLALIIWIWRAELRITSMGPFSWLYPYEQQKPEEFKHKQELDVTKTQKELEKITSKNLEQLKTKVIALFDTNKAIDEQEVASHLNINIEQAKVLLSLLSQEGKIRCDSVYKRSLYTSSNLPENLAIDKLIENFQNENKRIISKNSFIRVFAKYQLDAMVIYEQNDKIYKVLIEVKIFKRVDEIEKKVYQWILALEQVRQAFIEHEIKFGRLRFHFGYNSFDKLEYITEISSKIISYLIFVAKDEADFSSAKELAEKYSRAKDIFNNKILVFLEKDLRKK